MENNEPIQQLTKKERKELKRQKKMKAKATTIQTRHTKKIIRWVGWNTFGVAIITGFIWFVISQPKMPEGEIISRNGFHWHPELAIYVKGKKQELPPNINIGVVHQPIHTHPDDNRQGIVHLEFQGLTQKQDVVLGQFFKNWGKDIRSFGTNMRMTVNGKENTEYENYIMRDKDKIELQFD